MSEHTPGPWRQPWTIVTAADGSPIADCEIRRSTQPDGGDHALDREIEANARLIAATLDLLSALEAVWESGFNDIDPRIDYIEVQIDRDDWAAVGAAIAKARGRDD